MDIFCLGNVYNFFLNVYIYRYDPYFNHWATYPIGGDKNDYGGILQSAFWKIVILFSLSIVEISMSLYVFQAVKKIQLKRAASSNDILSNNSMAVTSPTGWKNSVVHDSSNYGGSSPIGGGSIEGLKSPRMRGASESVGKDEFNGSDLKRRTSSMTKASNNKIVPIKGLDIPEKTTNNNADDMVDDLSKKLLQHLINLSYAMFYSGALMSLSGALTAIYGIQNISFGSFNPYIFLLITTGSYLLVQISSFHEARRVEGYLVGIKLNQRSLRSPNKNKKKQQNNKKRISHKVVILTTRKGVSKRSLGSF